MSENPPEGGRKKPVWNADENTPLHRRDGSSVEAEPATDWVPTDWNVPDPFLGYQGMEDKPEEDEESSEDSSEGAPEEDLFAEDFTTSFQAAEQEAEAADDNQEYAGWPGSALDVPAEFGSQPAEYTAADEDLDIADALFSDEPSPVNSLWNPTGTDILEESIPEDYTASTSFRVNPDEEANLYAEADDMSWLGAANDITNRYVYQNELYEIVNEILGLAMKGDTAIQAVIRSLTLTRDPEVDAEQRARYERMLQEYMPRHGINIPNMMDAKAIIDMAYDELLGIGPLGPLWRDPEVTDILVNGPEHVTVERYGKLVRTPVRFRDLKHLQSTARRLSTLVDDRGVSRTNPIVTVHLPSARVQLVWEPIAVNGASVVIRKHRAQLTLAQLTSAGALTPQMVAFLADAVVSKATILVSGATGSGKTTYLNVLSGFIPKGERVIVIEDASELKLENSEVEYMLTKEAATIDDTVIVGFDSLLRASLRMRPDRIVVGEILDSAGAKAMLEASFTGHDGTMTTLHANNPTDALVRIAGLLREATGMPEDLSRKQVNNTFDLVLQVARDPSGVRLVTHVSAVRPDGTTEDLFRGTVSPERTTVFARPNPLRSDTPLAARMRAAGVDLTAWEKV